MPRTRLVCIFADIMKDLFIRLKAWLQQLSFRTGVMVAIFCVCCYVLSFAQMLLPISVSAKGVLWAVFYGMAKASQYTALLILGKAGLERLKSVLKRAR